MNRCGIILAGGRGTRLLPLTTTISKQLLPIFDKPLIYYPLSTLMLAGIKDILIIASNNLNMDLFKDLLGDGSKYGISLIYKVQENPVGLSDAFLVGEEFIQGRSVALALGDNIFYGSRLEEKLNYIRDEDNVIFGCKVANPSAYGVASFDRFGVLLGVDEKPEIPWSNWAVPGLYFYDSDVVNRAKKLKPSARGELEITDLTNTYIEEGLMEFIELPGVFWFDAGTHEGMLEASQFVMAVQNRTGEKIADLLEIAKMKNLII